MFDYDGVCIEWCQPAEVRLVGFHRNDGDAAAYECGDCIDGASAHIVEPTQERIAGLDPGADDVRGKAERQRQTDRERG
jgi:hypothetical protein